MPHEGPLRVTILYPDPRILSGVAIFNEAMRRSFDSSVQTHHFMVGRRDTHQGYLIILFNTLGDSLKLVWHLVKMRPDVVHINPSLNMKSVLRDGLFLLVMRIMVKREVFMFMHGWEEDLSARIAANTFRRVLFRFIYGWPRMTVVLASQFRDQMIAMGFRAEKVVVDSAMFDGAIFAKLVRRPHQGQRLIFVSRLVPGKGMWELLDAFILLKQRYSDLSLYIMGDGSEREALVSAVAQQKIQDVTICGYVSAEEKAQILLDSDLFVFPTSYSEGCPASLLEAMAAGLPCVTTRVGGIPDVFIDKENGILLEEVNPDAIVVAVAGLLDDAKRMAAISETNRKVSWDKYEAHSVSARIACRYRSVLDATAI